MDLGEGLASLLERVEVVLWPVALDHKRARRRGAAGRRDRRRVRERRGAARPSRRTGRGCCAARRASSSRSARARTWAAWSASGTWPRRRRSSTPPTGVRRRSRTRTRRSPAGRSSRLGRDALAAGAPLARAAARRGRAGRLHGAGLPALAGARRRRALDALLGDAPPPRGAVLAPNAALCETCPRKGSRPERLEVTSLRRLATSRARSGALLPRAGARLPRPRHASGVPARLHRGGHALPRLLRPARRRARCRARRCCPRSRRSSRAARRSCARSPRRCRIRPARSGATPTRRRSCRRASPGRAEEGDDDAPDHHRPDHAARGARQDRGLPRRGGERRERVPAGAGAARVRALLRGAAGRGDAAAHRARVRRLPGCAPPRLGARARRDVRRRPARSPPGASRRSTTTCSSSRITSSTTGTWADRTSTPGSTAPAPMRSVLGVLAKVGADLGRRILSARKEARELMAAIAGRTIHPVFALPGGISRPLDAETVRRAREVAPRLVRFAADTLESFRAAVLGSGEYGEALSSEVYRVRCHSMGMVDDGGAAHLPRRPRSGSSIPRAASSRASSRRTGSSTSPSGSSPGPTRSSRS